MRTRTIRRGVISATITAVLLSMGAHAGATAFAPATAESREAWQLRMDGLPRPAAHGCFTATYPVPVWREVACAAAPSAPMEPKISEPAAPMTMGWKDGLLAVSPPPEGSPPGTVGPPIRRAVGTFDSQANVASVRSPILPGGDDVTNAYTLQLNTNRFTTDLCDQHGANCEGWQQFIFANEGPKDNGPSGHVYIQYWLLRYVAESCPDSPGPGLTWLPHFTSGADELYCYLNSPAVHIEDDTSIKNLLKFKLIGELSGPEAKVKFTPDAGTNLYEVATAKVLDATLKWTKAEFNVFGYGYGAMATFNDGASVRVRTMIDHGTGAKPHCQTGGFSNEANSMFFGDLKVNPPTPPDIPPAPGEEGPALVFLEQAADLLLTPDCNKAVTIGDTHQSTFAGLLYDFQATGDFVEALVGTGFEVQARKVPGPARWPNTSLNRSAAVRMGTTTVAVCEGTRLMVDGVPAVIPPSGSLILASGVRIQRRGNIHHISDRSGNNMRVELRGSYIDLHVGLGNWPVQVRGLQGNPNHQPRLLQARNGEVYPVPTTFDTAFFTFLYNRFGNSWRVPPTTSLLSPCNPPPVPPGNPTASFFAGDLPWNDYLPARSACLQAGVGPTWLDACTLDVAVLGSVNAASVYVRRRPPVVDANPPSCPSQAGGCRMPGPPAGPARRA